MGKLHNKDEEANILDHDNRSLNERCRQMAAQLAEYEAEHANLMKERASMRESLINVESAKTEAFDLANERAIKIDNFNIAFANEKENLVWLHNRHTRLVSSRSISLTLNRFINRRLTLGFSKTKAFRAFRDGKHRAT